MLQANTLDRDPLAYQRDSARFCVVKCISSSRKTQEGCTSHLVLLTAVPQVSSDVVLCSEPALTITLEAQWQIDAWQ